MRFHVQLACAVVAICVSCPTASASTAFASTATASQLPPQGVYQECEPVDRAQCASQLAQIGGAGFQLVLDYPAWYGDASAIRTYAREAQADGVKIIWPLNYTAWRDPGWAWSLRSAYPKLAPDCRCFNNARFLRYAINLVRGLPATWGYYIGDELGPSQAKAVSALAWSVRWLDRRHPLLYVGEGSQSLDSALQPFESIANVAGADVYPIGSGGTAQSIGPVASTVQQLSQENGTSSAMVLQAFSWAEYGGQSPSGDPRWPTEAEMQTMRDEALAIDPGMILWYSIYDILRSHHRRAHWRDLVDAAFAPIP